MPAPSPAQVNEDSLFWRASPDGLFSIKSAYNFLRDQRNQTPDPLWMSIWRWPIPERAKYFMWQVFHNSLPTNSLRATRGLCDSNECPFECQSEETILHVLRDCHIASSVWLSVINPIYYSTFFSGNLQEWLRWNNRNNAGSRNYQRWPWLKIFGLLCWIIWKNRCRQAMEGTSNPHSSLLHHCKHLLFEEVDRGRLKHKVFNIPSRTEDKWRPPPEGSVRIDVDGSVKPNWKASAGGLIRDHTGQWLGGFMQKLGPCSSTMAEIHAIYTGLQLCKQKGFSKIQLFSDSTEAIRILMYDGTLNHPMNSEILAARSLIYSSWDLQIIHADRDSLRCADLIANMAHHSNMDLLFLSNPPDSCLNLMLADQS